MPAAAEAEDSRARRCAQPRRAPERLAAVGNIMASLTRGGKPGSRFLAKVRDALLDDLDAAATTANALERAAYRGHSWCTRTRILILKTRRDVRVVEGSRSRRLEGRGRFARSAATEPRRQLAAPSRIGKVVDPALDSSASTAHIRSRREISLDCASSGLPGDPFGDRCRHL
jgi:hypothetical protein